MEIGNLGHQVTNQVTNGRSKGYGDRQESLEDQCDRMPASDTGETKK